MKNYLETYSTVTSSQVDHLNNLRFDSILNIFQNLATAHATEIGMGFLDLKKHSNAFWVLTKIKFNVNDKLLQNDEIICRTWPIKPSTIRFLRDYEIKGPNGFVNGISEWCILDASSGAIRKLSTVCYPENLNHIKDRADVSDFLRLKIDVDDSDYVYTYKTLFCDIDCNKHVNNVAYAKMALNTFSLDEFSSYNFKGFEIHFISQSYYGNEIKIYKKQVENGVYVEGKIDNNTIFKTLFIK